MGGLGLVPVCAVAWALAAAAAEAPSAATAAEGQAPTRVTVHLDRSLGRTSPLVYGLSLPAPGTPGAGAFLPELLRNGSFEQAALVGPKPMPPGWSKSPGWQLFAVGGRHVIVCSEREHDEPLVLLARRYWRSYRLTLTGRKIDGPGGLCVLMEVQDGQNHVRWTLGANGNRQHVLETVGEGKPRLLAEPVAGRIETGRCYHIEMSLRDRMLSCSLDGRLIHHVGTGRFKFAGIGLGAADSTAEYFHLAAYEPKDRPLFLLDNPARADLDSLGNDWAPLRSEGNKVGFAWDPLYPLNGHFSQCIKVHGYAGGDAGIAQGGIPVAAGTTYRGRLHLRGTATGKLTVSLRSRTGHLLASQALPDPEGVWKPCDFALKPAASDPQASFCITVAGQGSVWVDDASLAPDGAASTHALRSDIVAALRALRPTLLCWPVGPGSAHYNWRRGVGPRETRPPVPVTDGFRRAYEPARGDFGTDEFLALCRDLGAEPVLVLNPRLGTPALLEWLDYCNGKPTSPMGKLRAGNGHPDPYGVRFWLVGPERSDELGAKPYAIMAGELARDVRGFRPDPQLILWADPTAGGARPAAANGQTSPLVTHLADRARWPLLAGSATLADGMATQVRALREPTGSPALLGLAPPRGPEADAYRVGLLLNALAREGGPRAIATCGCAPAAAQEGTAPLALPGLSRDGLAAWTLFRSLPQGELVQADVCAPDGSGERPDVVAERAGGGELVVRIVTPAESERAFRIRIEGLGGRRLAEHASHQVVGPAAQGFAAAPKVVGPAAQGIAAAPKNEQLPVRASEVEVSVRRGETVHAIILRLEGGQP